MWLIQAEMRRTRYNFPTGHYGGPAVRVSSPMAAVRQDPFKSTKARKTIAEPKAFALPCDLGEGLVVTALAGEGRHKRKRPPRAQAGVPFPFP